MRLWVAGRLAPAARAACGRWRDGLRVEHARRVPDDDLHLTLVFLGERTAEEAIALEQALDAVRGAADGIRLGAGLALPRRGPRVVALGLEDPAGSLLALHARVAAACGEEDERPYRPHVTVLRLGREARAPRELPAAPTVAPFAIDAIALMRSHLGRGPARHEELARFAL